jgi:carboxypeptidase C (cathepsin A)
LEENGPFLNYVVNASTKEVGLREQPWSWNRVANVIYLDSPAGVGFSYSETPSDYNTNDNKTAADTTTFLEIFFQQVYPEFAGNEFWITGESYAVCLQIVVHSF